MANQMHIATLQEQARDEADAAARAAPSPVPDDPDMLRAAVELSRDIGEPRPAVYWGDMLASALLGYAALAAAMLLDSPAAAFAAGCVAVLALYRAGSFIHELTHIRHSAVPGFRLGWNLLVGIPLMVPSFLYEGVHTLHHARTRYGTELDPEYLPLARMKPWSLPLFVLAALAAPLGVLIRFAILAPLSLLLPRLRTKVVASYSALSINPGFQRRPPEGELKTQWHWQEAATSLWAVTFVLCAATGVIALEHALIFLGVISGIALVNQIRTLVAHRWENDGGAITVTAQYLDSVNVPPPGLLPCLWAPVGLRYHALHHLLPSLPYHALGEAHRRMAKALEPDSPYHRANYPGLPGLVARLARSTMG
jgi:fatty acid desaturase